MKRSDAEARINEWLDNSNEITGRTFIDFVTKELGMLPPTIINPKHNGWQSDYSGIPSYINEWEPK